MQVLLSVLLLPLLLLLKLQGELGVFDLQTLLVTVTTSLTLLALAATAAPLMQGVNGDDVSYSLNSLKGVIKGIIQ